ncbi:MAG: hypothetical protein IIC22_06905 [Chloroflexi bacterium]|nr:hypothetical protein [Chloroflexota bacterium]
MEGLFFILIAGALFSHAWYLLGLYNDGRTMGIVMVALGAGALIALTFPPMLLGSAGSAAAMVAQITVMKSVIIMWAIYAAVVAAQGLWDFDDRALGFLGIPLAAVSILALGYFATQMPDHYDWTVWLSLTLGFAMLAFIAILLFCHLAIPFRVLKSFTAWSMLVLSVIMTGIGMAILATGITI